MRRACVLLLFVLAATACSTPPRRAADGGIAEGTRVDLVLLETTDLHTHVLGYDYDRLAADDALGFDRVAALIRQARDEFPNNVLLDAGDTIQGTALADYEAEVEPLPCTRVQAMYRAMDTLGYAAATIGNHEFNYGLSYLAQATGRPLHVAGVEPVKCSGPGFPFVLSNVYSTLDDQPLYAPYLVVTRKVKAYTPDGSRIEIPLHVGLLGFTPPNILQWDRVRLKDKVRVEGMVEAAQRWLPELRKHGVDVVVAVAHTGLDAAPYTPGMENAGWHLAGVAGIDALLLGHSHRTFPDPTNAQAAYKNLPEVDNDRGLVRGVPAVMGGFHARDLGVIKLPLVRRDGRWQVQRELARSEVRPVKDAKASVAPDAAIATLVAHEHQATIAHQKTVVGSTQVALSSVFAAVGDVSALGVVNAAQSDFVQKCVREHNPDYAHDPVLSAAAPFKTGFAGASDYTEVAAGPLSVRSASDLYLYPNLIAAVRIDGAALKAWLERSAERYNRIDRTSTEPQALLNPRYPGFNFDVIQGAGFTYTIDLAQPAGSRVALAWKGKPVDPAQHFVVATNSYRAADAGMVGAAAELVCESERTNRSVVLDWIKAHSPLTAKSLPPRPYAYAPLPATAHVTFVAPRGRAAAAKAAGVTVKELHDTTDGLALYELVTRSK